MAKPVDVAKLESTRAQSLPRTDHHLAARGIEFEHGDGLLARAAHSLTLAHLVIEDGAVAAKHAPIEMHDIAGLGGAWTQALDHLRVAPGRHEADILTVGLRGA